MAVTSPQINVILLVYDESLMSSSQIQEGLNEVKYPYADAEGPAIDHAPTEDQCSDISTQTYKEPTADTPKTHLNQNNTIDILVIDDEPAIQESMKEVLMRNGYRIQTVGSAGEGFELINNSHFDVIICDIRLPDIKTRELFNRLREIKGAIEKTIFMTGDTASEVIASAFKKIAHYYMIKPFSPRDLFAKMDEVIKRSRASGDTTS